MNTNGCGVAMHDIANDNSGNNSLNIIDWRDHGAPIKPVTHSTTLSRQMEFLSSKKKSILMVDDGHTNIDVADKSVCVGDIHILSFTHNNGKLKINNKNII